MTAHLSHRTRVRLNTAISTGRLRYWCETPARAGRAVRVTMICGETGASTCASVRDTRDFLSSGMALGAYLHAVR